ncbi:1824_t:CDS:2 [Entrophospora sp. SA101]|nr:1824_t:CDS:2 [Entrophospora sp. SA101]
MASPPHLQGVELILDFKWNKFGRKYYYGIWIIYVAFLLCFAVVTTTRPDQLTNETRKLSIIIAIILGIIHFALKIRQLSYNPIKNIRDFWDFFDVGAYSLSIFTSVFWLMNEKPPPNQLVSLSNLLLDLKFILFLRVFEPFGIYFATILVDKLAINDDQQHDNKTNEFASVPSSILAIFNLFTGDNSALESWSLQDVPYLVTLDILFSFTAVAYLINLFIAILGGQIDAKNEAFLAQKAKIIAEIELFYLLPKQRRRKDWFPDILTYNVPIDDIRKRIIEVDGSNEDPDYLPFISDKLRKLVGIPEPVKQINIENDLEQLEKEIKGIKDELRNRNNKIKDEFEKNLEKKMNENREELLNQMKILMDENNNNNTEIRSIKLSIPSIGLFTYENDYSIWSELENLKLYKYRDVQLILDFKWNKFGFKYYYGIWMIYIAFLSCFVIATTTQLDQLPNGARMLLIVIAIILGVFHLYFEIRQFSYNPKKYIGDISNLFGDNSAFESWKLQDDPYLAILYTAVPLIFIVCMAVLTGLLSNDIEKIDRKDEFWAQRARIIAEIELYYLHPKQRCRKDWFPYILPYNVSIDEIHKEIIKIDNSNEDPKLFIPDELRKLVGMPKPTNLVNIRARMERMENDLKEIKDELKYK